jgi:DNA-binding phage protein
MSTKTDAKFEAAYDRAALRSAFVSLFWAVISERRKRPDGFKLTELARQVGSTKHEVSRWFNGSPNWTLNTIARIARALNLDLVIEARDRATGAVYTPAGLQGGAKPMNVTSPAAPSPRPPPSRRPRR